MRTPGFVIALAYVAMVVATLAVLWAILHQALHLI